MGNLDLQPSGKEGTQLGISPGEHIDDPLLNVSVLGGAEVTNNVAVVRLKEIRWANWTVKPGRTNLMRLVWSWLDKLFQKLRGCSKSMSVICSFSSQRPAHQLVLHSRE